MILATLTTLTIIIVAVAIQAEVKGDSNKDETELCDVMANEFKHDFQPNKVISYSKLHFLIIESFISQINFYFYRAKCNVVQNLD